MDFTLEELDELKPQITVFGVGGAGGNAVNNMIESGLSGVSFVVANTDSQAITQSKAAERIQIGRAITQGLGAGAKPEIGKASAEENLPDIVENLKGSHMCFIAAGMGGGTGTGAAPVIARAAKEMDILTVGVVTKPFQFEGSHRMKLATQGIEELHQYVDTLIVIPNQNLFRIANERTTFSQAFELADQVLHSGVRGVTDLMLLPGLINLDFADVRSVMSEMGKAMMGTGEAEGDHRAIVAAEAAISNPLLDDVSLKGAKAVLINITGGDDLTLFDVDEATNRIRNDVDPEANIIFGAVFNEKMNGKVCVSVVATGIDGARPPQIAEDFNFYKQGASAPIEVKKTPSETPPSPPKGYGKKEDKIQVSPVSKALPIAKSTPASPIVANEMKKSSVNDIVQELADNKKETLASTEAPKKSFFGNLMRNKSDIQDSNPIQVSDTKSKEIEEESEEDNFEIPAFLRKSLY